MSVAFLIALALAVIILVIFGVGERGDGNRSPGNRAMVFFPFWTAYVEAQWRGCAGRVLTDWRATGATWASPMLPAQLIHV